MTKTPAKRFFASLALHERIGEASPNPVSSVQLLRKGAFQHAWHGQLEIDEPLFASLIRNFDSDARGIDIALDVEHMPDQGRRAGSAVSLRTTTAASCGAMWNGRRTDASWWRREPSNTSPSNTTWSMWTRRG